MKAILVPQDPEKPMIEVEGSTVREIAHLYTNIDWLEKVDTRRMNDLNFCMVVDEEGACKSTHPRNLRAGLISLYPGPIFGDALLLGTAWGDDGIDFISAPDHLGELLKTWKIQDIAGRH